MSEPTDPEAVWRVQVQFLLDVLRRSGTQPVEYVVVPLVVTLHANPGLLQQVMGDKSTHDHILETRGKD